MGTPSPRSTSRRSRPGSWAASPGICGAAWASSCAAASTISSITSTKTAPSDSGSSKRRCRMTSKRLTGLLALVVVVAVGCGDYSNEDLEFMNALPESDALQANIPPVTSAVELANEAELARSTHDTTRGFNGMLATLVGIVDGVRSYPPTARTANTRVWGPFPTARSKGVNLD